MKKTEIISTESQLNIYQAMITDATISMSCLNGMVITDVSATNVKIADANLSDLEIHGAQMGGAYIHSIGMPPEGHPNYQPDAKQRPLKFDDCNLEGSTITNCNLTGVTITNCNLDGMTINGVLVEDLLKAFIGE
jgi:uncharacterized protein YjbI with pentapeptide repeats